MQRKMLMIDELEFMKDEQNILIHYICFGYQYVTVLWLKKIRFGFRYWFIYGNQLTALIIDKREIKIC